MQKIFSKIKYFSYALVIIFFGLTRTVQAASYGGFETNLKTLIDKILTFAFGAAGAIFVVMFLIGGVQYMTSAGNEEAATKAKKLLMDAVIGLVIILASWAISGWILSSLGGTANFGN